MAPYIPPAVLTGAGPFKVQEPDTLFTGCPIQSDQIVSPLKCVKYLGVFPNASTINYENPKTEAT